MTDYQPITSELRRLAVPDPSDNISMSSEDFANLCDNIDSIHSACEQGLERHRSALALCSTDMERIRRERDRMAEELGRVSAERDSLAVKYSDARAFGERLEACAEEREDVTLWGVDYMALPLDADGKAVHIDDVMQWENGTKFEACGVSRLCLYYIDEDGSTQWTAAFNKTHYKKPTVEDVLREFSCVLMGKRDFDGDVADIIAEYASRLRLAGDGDE